MTVSRFVLSIALTLLTCAGCDAPNAQANACQKFVGTWKGWATTMNVSRNGDSYLVQIDNPAGMLGGNFTANCQNGVLVSATGAAIVLRDDGTLNYAGTTLQR